MFAIQASPFLLLDGKEVDMTAGTKLYREYSMYTNGHQLTQKSRNQRVYSSWAYIDQVELQERVYGGRRYDYTYTPELVWPIPRLE